MAIIRSIERGTSSVRRHPTQADATYQIIEDESGRLFHLTTYGSDDRVSGPKPSQTIQLDQFRAQELVGALREAFPGI